MHIDCQALGCLKCCQTYWISLLPKEAENIAKSQRLSLSEFLQKNCLLDLQVFPANKPAALTIPVRFFSETAQQKIQEYFGRFPPYLMALPGVVLQREKNGNCVFLDSKTGLCKTYETRPGQCRLFPFISIDNEPLHHSYPFCRYLENQKPLENPFRKDQSRHFEAVTDYFDAITVKGFDSVWTAYPKKGIVRLGGKVIDHLNENQFKKLLKRFSPTPT